MALIINIEGTDGSGKQTQSKLLLEKLQELGISCKLHSFPSYESGSSMPVRMYLGGDFGDKADCLDPYQASVLYAVDRLCTMKLLEKEEKVDVLILDRYTSSNMTHQAGKIDDELEKDMFLDWLVDLEFGDMKLPRPAITIFLDMPVEKSMELAHQRKDLKANTKQDIHEKDPEHLAKAYNAGKYVSKKYDWKEVVCVDENQNIKSIEEIHNEIMKNVLELLKEKNILE